MPTREQTEIAATICNALGGALLTIASALKQQARDKHELHIDTGEARLEEVVTEIKKSKGGARL